MSRFLIEFVLQASSAISNRLLGVRSPKNIFKLSSAAPFGSIECVILLPPVFALSVSECEDGRDVAFSGGGHIGTVISDAGDARVACPSTDHRPLFLSAIQPC